MRHQPVNLTKREREALNREQNHLRIVKKHQELTYSNKEKTKNAESKQEKISDPQVREHEAESRGRTGVTLKSVKKTENIWDKKEV